MLVINNLPLAEDSRIELFVLMVIWNAIYFKNKLRS